MRKVGLVLCMTGMLAGAGHTAEGLVTLQSTHDVGTTMDRLGEAARARSLTVFTRIDHAAGARSAGLELRPTQLLVFGNPRVGTPLMQCGPTAGIDLPQKALVWEDDRGRVWLAYNDPAYLSVRHGLAECDAVLAKVRKVLGELAAAAVAP